MPHLIFSSITVSNDSSEEPPLTPTLEYIIKQRDLYSTPLDFTNITPELISNLIVKIKDTLVCTYDYVAQQNNLNFADIMQPLINLGIASQKAKVLTSDIYYVHMDAIVRDASAKAKEELDKHRVEQNMRLDVYNVIKQYYDTTYQDEKEHLTKEEIRYVELTMSHYKRTGMNLPTAEQRERLKKLQKRLADLNVAFQKNLNSDNTSFEFTRDELKGLPDTWFSDSKLVREGVYKVTLKYLDATTIMEYCESREVRAKITIAFNSRAKNSNLAIAKEELILRNQLATLLGYANIVDYTAEINVIENSANVTIFLDEMNKHLDNKLKQELQDVRDYARVKLDDPNFELQAYDIDYFIRMREKEMCEVDHELIKLYFPRNKVINGILRIYQHLLGLSFYKLEATNVWHKDVEKYAVYDAVTGEHLGGFILDLSPREGKYPHAAVITLLNGADISKFTGIPEQRELNLCVIICDFAEDENLNFHNVQMFMHEFAHVMHHICSRTQLKILNGFAVEKDFIEAPSQMLENWCYDVKVLQVLSSHPETGLPIPAELVAKLRQPELLHAAYHNKRQLLFATFDCKVHMLSAEELETLDICAYWNELKKNILLLPVINDAFPATFGHIFGNDYFAGLYGYMYSNVMAACMFDEMFKDDTFSKKSGAKYRICILEPGSTKPAKELLLDLLGHPVTPNAFLKKLGLKEESPLPTTEEEAIASNAKRLKLV